MSIIENILVSTFMLVLIQNIVFTLGIGIAEYNFFAAVNKNLKKYTFLLFLLVTPLAFMYTLFIKITDLYKFDFWAILSYAFMIFLIYFIYYIIFAILGEKGKWFLNMLPIALFSSAICIIPLIIKSNSFGSAFAVSISIPLGFFLACTIISQAAKRLNNLKIARSVKGLPITLVFIAIFAITLTVFNN